MGLQYGIKEVMDVAISSFANNKPLFFVDYAEATGTETSAERLDLRGGIGNGKIMGFDHTKDATFTLTVPMVDLKMLALLAGEDLVTGAANVLKREVLTVAAGKVTLKETPLANSTVVFAKQGIRDHGTEYVRVASAPTGTQHSGTGKDVTFATSENGKEVIVYYQYATAPTAQKISVKANKFPQAVKINAIGIWRNQEDEKDYPVHVVVHKAKPQPNFTFTMESSNATSLEITFDVYGVTAQNGDIQYIDYVVEGLA